MRGIRNLCQDSNRRQWESNHRSTNSPVESSTFTSKYSSTGTWRSDKVLLMSLKWLVQALEICDSCTINVFLCTSTYIPHIQDTYWRKTPWSKSLYLHIWSCLWIKILRLCLSVLFYCCAWVFCIRYIRLSFSDHILWHSSTFTHQVFSLG